MPYQETENDYMNQEDIFVTTPFGYEVYDYYGNLKDSFHA